MQYDGAVGEKIAGTTRIKAQSASLKLEEQHQYVVRCKVNGLKSEHNRGKEIINFIDKVNREEQNL